MHVILKHLKSKKSCFLQADNYNEEDFNFFYVKFAMRHSLKLWRHVNNGFYVYLSYSYTDWQKPQNLLIALKFISNISPMWDCPSGLSILISIYVQTYLIMSDEKIVNCTCKLVRSIPLCSTWQLILIIQSIHTTFTPSNYLSEISHKINMSRLAGLLDCGAMWTCRWIPTFQRNLLPSPSGLMEAVCSSKTLVSTYKSTWCYNPEDQHRHLYNCQKGF
jgi:hypothetical protein